MSASKCGNIYAVVLPLPKVADEEKSELVLSERATALLGKIRLKEPGWSPDTIKGLWNKAYKLGLLDEQD